MKVHVQVFSFLRDYLPPGSSPRGELEVHLPDGADLKDLFISLGIDRRMGQDIFAGEVDNTFQVLVNHVAVGSFAQALADGDEVVMFPPMAGG
jgi:molybdopterin converting factor small subunit